MLGDGTCEPIFFYLVSFLVHGLKTLGKRHPLMSLGNGTLLNNEHLFLSVLAAGEPETRVPAWPGSVEGSLPDFLTPGERSLVSCSYEGHKSHHGPLSS